jgi:hypothetical protein
VSVATVRTPAEYEERLRKYLFERAEEVRAVRVGEKEISERAEIVARYADLFNREQLDALRSAEEGAEGDEHERIFRLRLECEAGVADQELSERKDELENAILAARVTFQDGTGEAGRPPRVRRTRRAGRAPGGRVGRVQRGAT